MKYTFTYQTTAFDLWQLFMYSIYGSMVGLSNIIFTIAMSLLSVKFWQSVNVFIKILLVVAICLFTIIQPVMIYMRAKKQVAGISQDIKISFDDDGIRIKTQNQTSEIQWSRIKGVSKKPSMVVILSTKKHGFILTNKVLGEQKEAFYNYVLSRIQK